MLRLQYELTLCGHRHVKRDLCVRNRKEGETCREYITRKKKFTAPACTNKTLILLTFLTKYAVVYIYEHKFSCDLCVEQIRF